MYSHLQNKFVNKGIISRYLTVGYTMLEVTVVVINVT